MPSTPPRRRPARSPEKEVDRLEREVFRAKSRLAAARRRVPPLELPDYALRGSDGRPFPLSMAFEGHADLVVIHNMGARCPMCTTWADGFSGVAEHLRDRAGLLLTSPDAPAALRAFARRRGWKFPVASTKGSTFARDLGFETADGSLWPGVSTVRREPDGRILRVAKTTFGPGDDFSPVFAVLPLLAGGQGDWWPRLTYPRRAPSRRST